MKLKKLLQGNLSKSDFAKIMAPIMLIQIIFWAVARTFYPQDGGYYIDFNAISRQGNLVQNPIGGWFFCIGTVIVSIFLIFYFRFVYQRLITELKLLCNLFLLSGIIGAIGLFLVGSCPEQSSNPIQFLHNLGSSLAFGGLGTALGLSFLILLIRIIRKDAWPTFSQFFCVFILPIHFILLIPFTLEWSVTQWTSYNLIFVWLVGFFIILPEDSNKL